MNASPRTAIGTSTTEVVYDIDTVCRQFLIAAFSVELLMLFLDATLNYAGFIPSSALRRVFNATREDGLASYIGVTQTFVVGAVLTVHAALARHGQEPRNRVIGWSVLAAFFLYLGVDDGTMFHERVGTFVDELAGDGGSIAGFPSYAWQLVFMPFFGAMGLFILWFVYQELRDNSSRMLVIGAMGLMGLSVVMDFFEGLSKDSALNLYVTLGDMGLFEGLGRSIGNESGYAFVLHFSKAIEECVEMAAMSLMLFVFVRHLLRRNPHFVLRAQSVPTT